MRQQRKGFPGFTPGCQWKAVREDDQDRQRESQEVEVVLGLVQTCVHTGVWAESPF